ncbi:MAG: PAS domain S-box protein [Deltaproteobacteria bacterium]|jgi:PAS domain S-box-containing protein|nr:PAS domain S-box protein [Deltaproteobacteria bacterium]
MCEKPTYEELEQKLNVLKKEYRVRKDIETALRESKEKYRLLVKNLPSIVYKGYADWSVEFFDEKIEHLTGFDLNKINSKQITMLDLIVDEDIKPAKKSFIQALKTDKSYVREFRIRSKTGKTHWMQERGQIICDDAGEIEYVSGVFFDITDHKHAEEVLRQSETRLKAVFEANPDPVVVYDTNGHPQYLNPEFINVFGWTLEDLKGKRIPFVPDDQKEITAAKIKELYDFQKPVRFETTRLTKDGQFLDIFISAAIIKDPESEASGMVVNLTDITEKKRLETRLQGAQRMEAIGTLAGGIAHDFNNLLMGIQGNASLLLLSKDAAHPDYEHLKNIENYVLQGSDLTNQLLGFARGGKYEVEVMNLNEVIKRENRMFTRTKKEIVIHEQYEQDLWLVKVSKGQIEQVLLNLYVNAWQAMPGGGDLYVQTSNIRLDQHFIKPFRVTPGKYVKISITDTGTGMDEATMQRIFEPFFTTKKMGRGIGLGLASVYGIIKNHGGFIDVYSEKGEGTAFYIYLPAIDAQDIYQDEEIESADKIAHGTETILLVDDEDMIVDVSRKLLEKLGYTVLTAVSGREAIEMYQKHLKKIALVIVDMIMPGLDGGETYDELKKIDPNIKVLLASGYSIDGQAQDILYRGCNGFIQKPFNIKRLSHKVRTVLDIK